MLRDLLAAAAVVSTCALWPATAGAAGHQFQCLWECHQSYPWDPEGRWATDDPDILLRGNECMMACAEIHSCSQSFSVEASHMEKYFHLYGLEPPKNVSYEMATEIACARRYVVNKPPANYTGGKASLILGGTDDLTTYGLGFHSEVTPALSWQLELLREEIEPDDRAAEPAPPAERAEETEDGAYLSTSVKYRLFGGGSRPYVRAGIGVLFAGEASDPAVHLGIGFDWLTSRRTRLSVEARYRELERGGGDWQALIGLGFGGRRLGLDRPRRSRAAISARRTRPVAPCRPPPAARGAAPAGSASPRPR